jgi:hypothetical protein
VIGIGTRQALRAWQKARGRPADAHLTQALSQQLRAEAAALVMTPTPLIPAPAAPPTAVPGPAATPH